MKTTMIDSMITKTKVCKFNPETNKYYTSVEKMDLYTMTDGDGHFLDHFVKEKHPEDSTTSLSQALAFHFYVWCMEYGVSYILEFIAGDSTNSNTGYKGGCSTSLRNTLREGCSGLCASSTPMS